MINITLLENLTACLNRITPEDEHLNIDELRGVFYAMMITPVMENQSANWIAALFYGEHPQLNDEQIHDLNINTRPVFEAYSAIFKANKLRFPFDLTKLNNEESLKIVYDWCRGFFVGLLVTETLWYGEKEEARDNSQLETIRAAAHLFAGLVNQDFSGFEANKVEELHAILREQGQEPTEELMAAALFPYVPAAVKTLQNFGIRIMQIAKQETKNAANTKPKPPRKMQRNEPCFCGSGIKYKKCCGA